MLIYDDFVFVHTPKTGGMFIAEALREEFASPALELDIHSSWKAIPPDTEDRPVLMYVRNPWDWYVSWYHYWTQWRLPTLPPDEVRQNQWARLLLGNSFEVTDEGLRGIEDFATVVRNACENLDPSHPVMAEMLENGEPHADEVDPGDDFYTANVKHLAGAVWGTDQLTIGRFESLVDDLERFFDQRGIVVADDLVARIRARAPVNAFPHRPYREYYDDELRDLVGRSCRMLIERFGYSF